MNRRVAAVLWILAALAVACFWAAFEMALGATARAHDWYPVECCHALDCAPIESMTTVQPPVAAGMGGGTQSLPFTVVKTIHGEAVVPPDFPRRDSKDQQSHACIRNGHLMCLFLAPGQ